MPSVPLNMPKMSMTMEEGTIVEWQVAEGDAVASGDVVAIVTTDKVDMEVEATATGTVEKILHASGAIVPVGDPIAVIESEQEDLLGDILSPTPTAPPLGRVIAAPLARKLAKEAGIDLAAVTPTGSGGIIRARDVRDVIDQDSRTDVRAGSTAGIDPRVANAPTVTSAPAATAAMTSSLTDGELVGDARSRRLRVSTAAVMSASAAIPQFTVERRLELDATARARRAALNGVGWTTLMVRAYAMMLRHFPLLGGSFTAEGVRAHDRVGVALAVDTPAGLLAPVLRDPDQQPIRELDAAIRQLAADARAGALRPDSMAAATGTVSNLGGLGVRRFNALLTPPQATALSLGSIAHRVEVAPDGTFTAVLGCDVGLTVDHRAADGADGARGLQFLQELFLDPLMLSV